MKKPAILFVHSNSELYGADFILWQIVKVLKEDVRPLIALPGEGELSERLRAEGAEVLSTRDSVLRRVNFKPARLPGFAFNVLLDWRDLRRIVRAHDVKLIYSNTSATLVGALTARLTRLPHLYHIHEIITDPPWLARAIARLALGNSSEVIAVSEAVKEQLLRYSRWGDPPVRVIHNGLDPTPFDDPEGVAEARRELGADAEQVLFGVIGRIHPWKGQFYFLEAARRVADQCPQARFAIVGGTFQGYETLLTQLHERVRQLDLQNRVRILTHRRDVPRLMRALDVFVLPSTSPDPLPTVVLEAMAARKPVVATAHGGALEMVLHEQSGLLAPFDDSAAFADALLRLAHAPELRRAWGETGRQRLESEFSPQSFAANLRQCVAAHVPVRSAVEAPEELQRSIKQMH